MKDFVLSLFSSDGFMPHGHCYLWKPSVLSLHIISDALIALAYYSIPFTLVYFTRKRKDVPFNWMFLCFALFIIACGTTHLMEIFVIWHPTYWLSGWIKAFTALVSIPTAILLVKLVPKAIALPSPAALRAVNAKLESEVSERQRAEESVRRVNNELERRVAERTEQLEATNRKLILESQERQRTQEEVFRLNAELEERVRLRTAELEAANNELEAFSYSVSHDLRAPLRAINGFASMIHEDYESQLPEEGRYFLERIRAGGQQMGKLIDDLLEFSRLNRQSVSQRTVDCNHILRDALEELKSDCEGRQIDFKIGELPGCKADAAMLKQAWINLLSNAIKYSRGRTPAVVEVGCLQKEGVNVYFIRDNGAGFDMKYADKLFGVFHRLHRAEEFEGTGVGLAIVHRIIERHGGRIWAEAELNRGATFYFTLAGS